jgi:hypothetical protein
MEFKAWYTSKVAWLNIGSFVVTVMESTQFLDVVPDSTEKYAALVVFGLNFWLRIGTSSQLTTSASKAELLNK